MTPGAWCGSWSCSVAGGPDLLIVDDTAAVLRATALLPRGIGDGLLESVRATGVPLACAGSARDLRSLGGAGLTVRLGPDEEPVTRRREPAAAPGRGVRETDGATCQVALPSATRRPGRRRRPSCRRGHLRGPRCAWRPCHCWSATSARAARRGRCRSAGAATTPACSPRTWTVGCWSAGRPARAAPACSTSSRHTCPPGPWRSGPPPRAGRGGAGPDRSRPGSTRAAARRRGPDPARPPGPRRAARLLGAGCRVGRPGRPAGRRDRADRPRRRGLPRSARRAALGRWRAGLRPPRAGLGRGRGLRPVTCLRPATSARSGRARRARQGGAAPARRVPALAAAGEARPRPEPTPATRRVSLPTAADPAVRFARHASATLASTTAAARAAAPHAVATTAVPATPAPMIVPALPAWTSCQVTTTPRAAPDPRRTSASPASARPAARITARPTSPPAVPGASARPSTSCQATQPPARTSAPTSTTTPRATTAASAREVTTRPYGRRSPRGGWVRVVGVVPRPRIPM